MYSYKLETLVESLSSFFVRAIPCKIETGKGGWARMGKASSGKCNRIVQDASKTLESSGIPPYGGRAIAARFGLASWLLFTRTLGCSVTGQSKVSLHETPRSSPTVTGFIISLTKTGDATHRSCTSYLI